jgi:tetratricopeptide (TPR) repeat protein
MAIASRKKSNGIDTSAPAIQLEANGKYAEAAKMYAAALTEVERYRIEDQRLPITLNNLALVYSTLGRYGEAEPLYQRPGSL